MTLPEIDLKQLISSYEQTLGIDGARRLIINVLVKAGLSHKESFNPDEMSIICGFLNMEKGFIATTASILLARIRLQCWNKKTEHIRAKMTEDN